MKGIKMLINKIWSEKYRPQTIEECILPSRIKNIFLSYKDKDIIPNLLLSGSSGVGKTTIARALCNELQVEYMEINGSDENGIDILRNKISEFISSYSLNNVKPYKIVILDESDGLTQQMQDGLRNFIEKHSSYCRFIFTCNNFNKLTDAIKSRTVHIPFDFNANEKNELIYLMSKRIYDIMKGEGRDPDLKLIGKIVLDTFPDFRNAINILDGIDSKDIIEIKNSINNNPFRNLIGMMKEKNFKEISEWVEQNCKNNSDYIFSELYDHIRNEVEGTKKCQAILDLCDYQYKHYFAKDKRITLLACLLKLSTLF